MSWVSFALALVKLANLFFEWQRSSAQQQIGEDREKMRQFHAMQAVSDTLKAVDERFDGMSDEDVLAEIEAKGDFRDE